MKLTWVGLFFAVSNCWRLIEGPFFTALNPPQHIFVVYPWLIKYRRKFCIIVSAISIVAQKIVIKCSTQSHKNLFSAFHWVSMIEYYLFHYKTKKKQFLFLIKHYFRIINYRNGNFLEINHSPKYILSNATPQERNKQNINEISFMF